MQNTLSFTDFNFKLAVVQELMYVQQILAPKFDLASPPPEFSATVGARTVDQTVIPEARAYFERLAIPAEYAPRVRELAQDGGDEIYLQLIPDWDGEDDTFVIRSAAAAAQFPNLVRVTLFYSEDEAILEQSRARGIEARWL